MPSVYEQVIDEVVTQLETLTVPAPSESSIPKRRFDWEDIVSAGSAISVRYVDEPVEGEGTLSRDDWGYPVHVCMLHEKRMQLDTEEKNHFQFEQDIRRKFHNERILSGVSDSGTNEIHTTVTRGPSPPDELAAHDRFKDKDIRVLTIWAWFREPRS